MVMMVARVRLPTVARVLRVSIADGARVSLRPDLMRRAAAMCCA